MSGIAETLYLRSPTSVQQLAVAAYGWWWYRRRFSAAFHDFVRAFVSRETWSPDQFAEYQSQMLARVLSAAWHAPHYRAAIPVVSTNVGESPEELLAKLPLLSKEKLRASPRHLLTRTKLPRGTIIQRSSGTTGTPTEIFYDPAMHAFELAVCEARSLRWAGVGYHDRRVMFGARKICDFRQSRPPFWRHSPAEDMAYCSIYHLAAANLPHYVAFLRSYRPTLVMGYPSALGAVAAYAVENGVSLPPARAVITTSETLSENVRTQIETAWGCRVYDRYGAVECCVFASQCEEGRYHVAPEVGVVEILDESGHRCPPGVIGEVVCTGLHNTLQPLIRYRIGDAARWAERQHCPCGRRMAIIEAVIGRIEDTCYTPDGRPVVRFDTAFKGVSTIREAQVIQESTDHFVVRVVPASGYRTTDAARIQANMRLHVGDVRTTVQLVDAIPRLPSGKFQAVINMTRGRGTQSLAAPPSGGWADRTQP